MQGDRVARNVIISVFNFIEVKFTALLSIVINLPSYVAGRNSLTKSVVTLMMTAYNEVLTYE